MTTTAPTSHRELVAETARRVVAEHPPASTPRDEFLGACFDAGLAWVHFPHGSGGLGVEAGLQDLADSVLQGAGGPVPFAINPIGYGMAAPTVVEHARPEVAAELLRPLATCEELWCQLFSEPGAGSDLAGLATRAVLDGDTWVVEGQKVWTSLAHRARRALLLARTDPDVPKHRGLTYFVLDMTDPGVEVRPLRQMTGAAEFNEVHLDGARIPDSHRLGEVGQGWRVAMTTLMNERRAIGGGSSRRGSGSIGTALRLWRERPDLRTPTLRDRLTQLFAAADAARLTGERQRVESGDRPVGPEGSIPKLVGAELNQAVYDFCMDLLGVEATLYGSYDPPDGVDDATDETAGAGDVQRAFLRSRANTIEGGTSEVLRNILGERLLGLPGEPRTDTNRPWREVPRG
ncbi:Acyl-CoA dehydrogenase [Geodermatophilus telluris]|uniref:Acyl-CoA dehydrogenase n=1 Tax=Geodermatophilus telluris TaxID=1190417 RepID=A0A1G6JQT4_9ACTN|nr:acyl-CoA dehydrogenase family protein [Geodermatophilus telluris]SDC21057.1 Acyl-CoA dehydrogenase [Geodermatophilus telluris]